MKVLVIDLGTSNIRSLISALTYLGVQPIVTSNASALASASHVILPGVGAFDPAMKRIAELSLFVPLRTYAIDQQQPILGVCLGMQLLFDESEEGELPGLGLVAGRFRKLSPAPQSMCKVPHVGFSSVYGYRESAIFKGLGSKAHFYFTHSYALPRIEKDCNVALCDHAQPFVAAFQRRRICGVQFHPEKSQSTGLKLLSNFLEFV
ncbi:MAG: Imidazole glycerol phosphate synthase subunit HisH [Nitrosomonadaceae bacterium]|nr:Imidazole glycerol phosphate synthase subunit HisH [Nitrosomonadaceae bacterium]